MNVYIYEGTSREFATVPIVEKNVQPELEKVYTVGVNSGILVIAIPNDG